jgi:uncharacterized protein with GYD domain
MRTYSLIFASALAIGLAAPAVAEQSTHRYVVFFKYADNAVKAMTENPQDRSAQGAKASETFGGKQEAFFLLPSGEYDGMAINEFPDETSAEALKLFVRATGNFTKFDVLPLMTAEEFKATMQKAKDVKTTYTPPTATKQ